MASLTIDNELSEKAAKVFAKEGLSLKDAVDRFLRDKVKKDVSLKTTNDDIDEYYSGSSPMMLALRKVAKACEGAAEKAGFKTEEEFNDYFFNEFRPAFLEERKKEKGYA